MLSHNKFRLALAYVRKMTDEKGMIEHAKYNEPNKTEGYTTDDNARAFQAALRVGGELAPERKIYLRFLQRAVAKEGFHNDMDAMGKWVDAAGVGEWYGRAMAAVAEGVIKGEAEEKRICREIFEKAKPGMVGVDHLRTAAQLVIAGEAQMADKLVTAFEKNREADWMWFESGLYHDNGRLPMAMFVAYGKTGRKKYLQIGKESLDFWLKVTFKTEKGYFMWPGTAGGWRKGEEWAEFDQQPIEAGSTVEVCVTAYEATGDVKYREYAEKAWEWYEGRNVMGLSLIDEQTGGIRDGLHRDRCNLNEGAEAVLSFILAGISLSKLS